MLLKISVKLISSLILGFSLIISALILKGTVTGEEQNNSMKDTKSQLSTVTKTNVMTIKQLSEYLQVSKESVESIMKKDKIKKRNITGGGYDTYQFLRLL